MPFNDPLMAAAFWLVSAVGAWWIARSVQQRAEFDRGQSVVRYSPGIRALSVVGWLGAIALTAIAILEPNFPWWCRIYLAASAFFIAAVLNTELKHACVLYDAMGVHVISPWRGDRMIAWSDFRRAYHSSWNDGYVLESNEHGKLVLHRYMSGVESLLHELADRDVPVEWDI